MASQPSVSAPLANRDAVLPIRDASRRIVRELGFMKPTLAGTELPASAVHALIEIGNRGGLTATELCDRLNLEKSSVSRMLRKLIDGGDLAEVSSDTDGRSKRLTLTARGRRTLAAIDAFAHEQVGGALACLPAADHAMVVEGLRLYADALQARRAAPGNESKAAAPPTLRIEPGYRPGLIGRAVDMHAQFYARAHGFGAVFESRVAAGLADFLPRLERPCNAVWTALDGDRIVGTVAIDGEDLSGDAPAPAPLPVLPICAGSSSRTGGAAAGWAGGCSTKRWPSPTAPASPKPGSGPSAGWTPPGASMKPPASSLPPNCRAASGAPR